MFTSLRHLRTILVNFIIITLVYAPALSSSQFGRSSQFAVKTVRSNTPNSSLIPLHSLLPIPPHVEHRLLIKFRDEASSAQRLQIVESYGEPELQTRRVGESVITLKLNENVSSVWSELKRMENVVEWVEPDYLVKSSQQESSQFAVKAVLSKTANRELKTANSLTAIIDTGLSGKSELGWNFLNDSKTATDDNGHGSEMARIVMEVNPKVSLLPLKALDANGIGTISKIAAAIDYATNNHAGVILHSFGTSEPSKLLEKPSNARKWRELSSSPLLGMMRLT